MADKGKITQSIRSYLSSKGALSDASIGDTDSLLESGLIDSLTVMELSEFIQQEYGIALQDDDLVPENFDSLQALTDLVAARI